MTTVRHDTRAAAALPAPGRPRREAPARPPLRVVRTAELSARARRRRARLLLVAGMTVVAALLLGLVAFQVLLTQGQVRLERLGQEATAQQDRYERLRLQVAQLESPERVVASAQERLGMVPPASIRYLAPRGATEGAPSPHEPAPTPERLAAATARQPSPPATTDWSQVKPHLAARP